MIFVSIRDTKIEFMTPALVHNIEEAKRSLRAVASDKSTTIGTAPEDFELWEVGSWDPERGLITSVRPNFVCKAVDLLG